MEYPLNVYTSTLREDTVKAYQRIADLSYGYKWDELLDELEQHRDLINSCRLPKDNTSPPKLFTPLHQAANGKAQKEVFEKLLALGASKSLKTAAGETAYDIGKRVGLDSDILSLIEVPEEIKQNENEIKKMEEGLHKAINGRVEDLVKKNGLQLPQLSFLYEFGEFWYPVPGMYGGFSVSKNDKGIETSSWCRVAGGSGQRHVIDKEGNVELVEEGFC